MKFFTLNLVLLSTTLAMSATESASLVLRADQSGPVIHRNLYGHFAEHLGRCIYGGIWVGPDSPIPNTRGIRNDVIAAILARAGYPAGDDAGKSR
mgnify:CR=1 FL=1